MVQTLQHLSMMFKHATHAGQLETLFSRSSYMRLRLQSSLLLRSTNGLRVEAGMPKMLVRPSLLLFSVRIEKL